MSYPAIAFGWFFVYRHFGFGMQGLGVDLYIDPGWAPLLFLQEVVTRLPILLLAQLTGPPAEIWGVISSFWPYGKLLTAVAAFLILSFIAFCLFPIFKRDAVSRFWLSVNLRLFLLSENGRSPCKNFSPTKGPNTGKSQGGASA